MDEPVTDVMEPTLWRRGEWTAKVVRSEVEDGWAVQMHRNGDPEAALVGPWTMGRDKKNPKPLDQGAFTTLVKTANEVLARHEQAAAAMLKKAWTYRREGGQSIRVTLDILPDEENPRANLACVDDLSGELLRAGVVPAGFRLTAKNIENFITTGE